MTTKRFLRFQIILLILLAITLIGNTFSWATRPAVKGGGFMGSGGNYYESIKLVTDQYYINGNQCSAVTYKGTYNEETGKVTYDDEIEGNSPTPVTEFTDNDLTKGEVHYFKTIITNPSEVKTNVSLFLSGYTENELTSAMLGVSTPITTRGSYPQSSYDYSTGLRYFKHVSVISEYEVAPAKNGVPSTAKIEWFVYYNEASDEIHHGEFHISDIVFTNN